jgi:hypothetical protein
MNAARSLSRRQFLSIVALGSTAGLALKLGLDVTRSPEPIRQTRILMGTVVNLTVVGDDRPAVWLLAGAGVLAVGDRSTF